jgi:drug/metabolite transporter (DMT)-like permease
MQTCSAKPAEADGQPAPAPSVPIRIQLALGASIAGNVLLTNYATEYLSFPIQVIFKSSKLMVAMFIRSVVFKKPNKRIDYYCATLLSAGLICFMWPSKASGESVRSTHRA